jgi:predicted secreted protein
MATVLFNSVHNGSVQRVCVGDMIEIQLVQRPTGYLWGNETLSNDNIVFQQKQTASVPGRALGAGTTTSFLFQVCKAGSTTIDITRRRPWEQLPAGGGAQSFCLTLEIQ